MIRSIRSFLFTRLSLAVIVAALGSIIGSLSFVYHDFRNFFDERLANASLIIQTLVADYDKVDARKKIDNVQNLINHIKKHCATDTYLTKLETSSFNKLRFSVQNSAGKTVLHSPTPDLITDTLCKDSLGFSTKLVQGEMWRALIMQDSQSKMKICVAENYTLGHKIQKQTIYDLLIIMLCVFPLLLGTIWLVIGFALRSILAVGAEIHDRSGSDLTPVKSTNIPKEILPLITEINQLFTKLTATLDVEKRFANDAAHELKTPLAGIRTQAQVALNTYDEKTRFEALHDIIKGVDRGTHIVQQLLTLSRIIPETIEKEPKEIDLIKVASETIVNLYANAKNKSLDIELVAPPAPQIILGNPNAIEILMKNLVDNSIRYTPNNGWVKVVIEETDQNIILKVIDSGCGIANELHERVFECFYRVLGNGADGSGLGLSIVKQIVRLHKADIKLFTPDTGQGLEVRITFNKIGRDG